MPKVSIITPLHNKADFISETVQSVLSQTLSDWEMIIVENGSTDGGPDVVRRFSDPRIQLAISPRNGPGAARNHGLEQAKGEWVLFLDADDLLEPDYLAARLAAAQPAPDVKVVAGPWKEFDHGGEQGEQVRFPAGWRQSRETLDAAAFAYAPWVVHAAIVRREHLSPERRWNEALDRLPSEDCAFWFPVVYQTSVGWSEHSGARYRRNISCSRDDQVRSIVTGFSACVGTVEANFNFLKQKGLMPAPAQAATVVRVLRRMLTGAVSAGAENVPAIDREICRWLRATSYFDLKMLFWRCRFGEFRHGIG